MRWLVQETKWGYSSPKLIKGNGKETWQTCLIYVFVSSFRLDRAQTTIESEMCWSNWPIETFLLRYSTVVSTLKQGIVQSHVSSNINFSAIVFIARFQNQSLNKLCSSEFSLRHENIYLSKFATYKFSSASFPIWTFRLTNNITFPLPPTLS